jgi:hypothetical protein
MVSRVAARERNKSCAVCPVQVQALGRRNLNRRVARRAPRGGPLMAVRNGEAAVNEAVLRRIDRWFH